MIRASRIRKKELLTHHHGLPTQRISIQEQGEEMCWRTLVQKNLFPAIVKGLLRVFVLAALENGRKRGDVLNTSPKPVRQKTEKSEKGLPQRRARESRTCGCPS
jgi:hypothetical protein